MAEFHTGAPDLAAGGPPAFAYHGSQGGQDRRLEHRDILAIRYEDLHGRAFESSYVLIGSGWVASTVRTLAEGERKPRVNWDVDIGV